MVIYSSSFLHPPPRPIWIPVLMPMLRFVPTECAQCGYPSAKIRSFEWGQKAKRRKTTGTGRMRYLKEVSRRFKNGFRSVQFCCYLPVPKILRLVYIGRTPLRRSGRQRRRRHELVCDSTLPDLVCLSPFDHCTTSRMHPFRPKIMRVPWQTKNCFLFFVYDDAMHTMSMLRCTR